MNPLRNAPAWGLSMLLALCAHAAAQDPMFPQQSPEAAELTTTLAKLTNKPKLDVEKVLPLVLKAMELQQRGENVEANTHDLLMRMGKDAIKGLGQRIGKTPHAVDALATLAMDEQLRPHIRLQPVLDTLGKMNGRDKMQSAMLLGQVAGENEKRMNEARPGFLRLLMDKDKSVAIRAAMSVPHRDLKIEVIAVPMLRQTLKDDQTEDQEWMEALQCLLRMDEKSAYAAMDRALADERGQAALQAFRSHWMREKEENGIPVPAVPAAVLARWRKMLETEKDLSARIRIAQALLLCQDEKSRTKTVPAMFEWMRLGGGFGGGMGGPGGFLPVNEEAAQALADGGDTVAGAVRAGLMHKDARVRAGCCRAIAMATRAEDMESLDAVARKAGEKEGVIRAALDAQLMVLERIRAGCNDPDPDESAHWFAVWVRGDMDKQVRRLEKDLAARIRKDDAAHVQDGWLMQLSRVNPAKAIEAAEALMQGDVPRQRRMDLEQRVAQMRLVP